jgi:hypothetical protein
MKGNGGLGAGEPNLLGRRERSGAMDRTSGTPEF